jgi:hypothetical protein
MTQSVVGCIEQVQTLARALGGIRSAPNEPPEKAGAFPFAMAYEGAGRWTIGEPAGALTYRGDVVLEIHVARKDMPMDVQALRRYIEELPEALADDPTLDGNASTIVGDVTFEGLVASGYAGVETLAYRWRVNVKVQVV